MERFSDEAVVLSTVDYGDADRLVTLLTRDHGRLTAFAAGARASKRRFAGALQPMIHLTARLVSRRSDTFRLDGVDVRSSFPRVATDLDAIAWGLHAVELARELSTDHSPQPALLDALVAELTRLDGGDVTVAAGLSFELAVLRIVGLEPRLARCARCERQLSGALRFDPAAGGLVCASCAVNSPRSLAVSDPVARALLALQRREGVELPAPVATRVREVLDAFIAHHVGRSLKTAAFLAQLR